MQAAIDQFRANIARVRNLGIIHNTLLVDGAINFIEDIAETIHDLLTI